MLFSSYEFIFLFLPITFLIYFSLLTKKLFIVSKCFLVFSSLFFYSWFNLSYLPLIVASVLFNYTTGNLLNGKTKETKISRKKILIFGIFINMVLLGYFKYYDFFVSNINSIFNRNLELHNLILPLAISFFTFQQIAYLVDCYRQETKEYDLLNYSLFVTFFPQLIAGPIVHHKEMMPQFSSKFNLVKKHNNIALGIFIFFIGLFKKVYLADNLAIMVTHGFEASQNLNTIEAWLTSLSYTSQLYFDFCGYTDMAIGIALLFNIQLPINFNTPYKALNIQDFWRRWNMTLSRFLRAYLYIPLGGNRTSQFRISLNLMITFILGGLWHGAGFTFIFWGFLHGLALIVQRLWHKTNIKMSKFIGWFITFNFINISWVFFRANDFKEALNILKAMFIYKDFNVLIYKVPYILANIKAEDHLLFILFYSLIASIAYKNSIEFLKYFKPNYRYAIFTIVLAIVSLLEMHKVSEFLYFNF